MNFFNNYENFINKIGEKMINKEKEEIKSFLKKFSSVTISKICKDLNVDKFNVMKCTASLQVLEEVKKELIKRLNELCERGDKM